MLMNWVLLHDPDWWFTLFEERENFFSSSPHCCLTLKMAVRGNSLMPFSIQAILNKKDDSRHLPDLDMCFSKTTCWKIFGEMNGGSRGDAGEACEPAEQKSYDSDSGLSDDNDSSKTPEKVCKSEKDADPGSDVPEESLQEETDQESAAAENAKSDSEPVNGTGEWLRKTRVKNKLAF